MRPTHCGSHFWNKTGSLKLPQPIWPFNIRGLPNIIIAEDACELLPHIFTITATRERVMATLFSVALSVTKTFLFLYPPFQVADYPLLPGLSSFNCLKAVEKLAPKYTKSVSIEFQ